MLLILRELRPETCNTKLRGYREIVALLMGYSHIYIYTCRDAQFGSDFRVPSKIPWSQGQKQDHMAEAQKASGKQRSLCSAIALLGTPSASTVAWRLSFGPGQDVGALLRQVLLCEVGGRRGVLLFFFQILSVDVLIYRSSAALMYRLTFCFLCSFTRIRQSHRVFCWSALAWRRGAKGCMLRQPNG